MRNTQVISDRNIIPNRASGYELEGNQLKNQAWVSPTFNSTADGTLYFNVLDLAKWDGALYGNKLLTQSSMDRILSVYPLNDGQPNPAGYGFAWFLDTQRGHKRIEHGGAWQGFTCDISRYPDDGLSVAVLTNLDSEHSNPGYFAHVIVGLVDQNLLPSKGTLSASAIPDTMPARTARLVNVLTDISTGNDFSSEAAPQVARIPYGARQMVASVWPGGTITLLQQTQVQGITTGQGLYRVVKDGQAIQISFAIGDDGKIATLGFRPSREYDDFGQ